MLVLLVVTVVTIMVIVVSMIVDSVAVVIITRMITFVGPGGTFWHPAALEIVLLLAMLLTYHVISSYEYIVQFDST